MTGIARGFGVKGVGAGLVAGACLLGALIGGCGLAASTGSLAPTATFAVPSLSPAIAETRRLVAAALSVDGLDLQGARQAFRPPESSLLVGASRGIFQVVLPGDPSHGFIVVYEFRDGASAAAAGAELARYLGGGPGSVQFPPDAQHLIRLVGTTLVVYSWSPANSTDSQAPAIFTALASVGTGIDIPR